MRFLLPLLLLGAVALGVALFLRTDGARESGAVALMRTARSSALPRVEVPDVVELVAPDALRPVSVDVSQPPTASVSNALELTNRSNAVEASATKPAPASVDAGAVRATARLELKLLDSKTGAPRAGIGGTFREDRVEGGDPAESLAQEADRSDAGGWLRMRVPAERPLVVVLLDDEGEVLLERRIEPLLAQAVRVQEWQVPARRRWHGRFVSTLDGAPAIGAEVRALLADGSLAPTVIGTVDESGELSLDVEPEMRLARIGGAGYGPRVFELRPGHTDPAAPQIVQVPRAARLSVTLVDANDAPLVGTAVTARADGAAVADSGAAALGLPAPTWEASTDDSGQARFADLPSGVDIVIEAAVSPWSAAQLRGQLALNADDDRTLTLRPVAGSRVHGKVLDASGATQPGVEVWLVRATRAEATVFCASGADRPTARCLTDADGEFAFEDVPAEAWWIGPAPSDAEDAWAPSARWINVPARKGALAVDLELVRGTYWFGHVRDTQGVAVGGVRVRARSPRGGYALEALTDDEGVFRLGPGLRGPIEIFAEPGPGHSGSEHLSTSENAGLVLDLRPGAAMHLLAMCEGTDVEWTSAILTSLDGAVVRVDRRAISGLEDGTYAIAVSDAAGRVGIARSVRIGAGRAVSEVRIEMLPAANVVVSEEGPWRFWLEGACVAELPTLGTAQVPPGRIRIERAGRTIGEVELAAGDRLEY